MKAFLLPCALFLALLLLVAGTSAQDLPQAAHESAIEEPSGPQARITCDLASWGGFNHALCAAHCIFKGYKGGYCNDKAVCVCRN